MIFPADLAILTDPLTPRYTTMTSLSDDPVQRIVVTLLHMAAHARTSADLHAVHGDIGEAQHWNILAGMWEERARNVTLNGPVVGKAVDSGRD